MRAKLLIVALFTAGIATAQTWPDYHLTNGTHYTSYGVETYDPLSPIKNLWIDPLAVLQAGATEIDDIYGGNEVYLNGGTIYASATDADDFTWNSGYLHLNGGVHTTTYGLDSGAGKTLNIDFGAVVESGSMSLPIGNQLNLNEGGLLSVGHFDASMGGFQFNTGGTLEVRGVLTGMWAIEAYQTIMLNGSATSWDLGNKSLQVGEYNDEESAWLIVQDGAEVLSNGGFIYGDDRPSTVEVTGFASRWVNSGHLEISGNMESQLMVRKGGLVECQAFSMGAYSGYHGNVLEVTGSNSQCSVGILFVGHEGDHNTVLIQDGGALSSSWSEFGGIGSHNLIRVVGQGSRWDAGRVEISPDLSIMDNGHSNRIEIQNGGVVNCSRMSIGRGIGNDGQGSVEGVGSELNISGGLNLGKGFLDIQDGGVVKSSSSRIGENGEDLYPYIAAQNWLYRSVGDGPAKNSRLFS
jgi:T5SS/PEP-CTERM-associated repeat protein